MNKIFFIDYSQNQTACHPQHFFAPLEIGYCASLLEKYGWDVCFLDLRVHVQPQAAILSMIEKLKPDILLCKPIPETRDFIIQIAQQVKCFVPYRYCYGPAATLWPDMFLYPGSPITGCLLYEIEYTVCELAQTIQAGNAVCGVNGIASFDEGAHAIISQTRALIDHLDALPFPRHSLFVDKGYSFEYPLQTRKKIQPAYILTTRGCPEACAFCSIFRRSSYGKTYRTRSIKNVVDELEKVIALGCNTVYFVDDNFTFDTERAQTLCYEMIQRNIHKKLTWAAQCSVKSLNENVIKMMKQAGCSTVCLGIESASEKTRMMLGKTIAYKAIIDSIQCLKQERIMIVAFFMIGCPGETAEDVLDSISFCKKIAPDMLQLHYCSIYPDTPLCKTYTSVKHTFPYRFDADSNISNIPDTELDELYHYFYRAYYVRFQPVLQFVRKQAFVSFINWRQKIPFYVKSIKYILKRTQKRECCDNAKTISSV